MGRVKQKIKKLQSMNGRQATYSKRKNGVMKKAKELSILCDIDVVLLMFSPAGKPSLCSGKHSIGEVIAKFAQLTPQERAKRELENLEALKRTCMKINHDVNISEFLYRKFVSRIKPTVEVLSEKVMFLKTHLSDIHKRLSYWPEIEKSDSIVELQRVETSLRYTLAKIRTHMETMRQHQQLQLITSECKNQLQTEKDIDLGTDMEQELEKFSCFRTDENMNVPLQEDYQSHTYKDMACSASSSIECYSGLFGKSSDFSTPNLETGGIPRKLADPRQQFSNLSFLNDPKLQQLAEWNLLGSPADYYVSQILEASDKPQFGGNKWASSETLPYPVAVFDDHLFSRQPN